MQISETRFRLFELAEITRSEILTELPEIEGRITERRGALFAKAERTVILAPRAGNPARTVCFS